MTYLSVVHLENSQKGIVVSLHGGCEFQCRLRGIGIKEGKTIRVVARHPLSGPVVLEVDRRQVTLGRGMAQRIEVSCAP